MKVGQLIEELQKQDYNMDVVIPWYDASIDLFTYGYVESAKKGSFMDDGVETPVIKIT